MQSRRPFIRLPSIPARAGALFRSHHPDRLIPASQAGASAPTSPSSAEIPSSIPILEGLPIVRAQLPLAAANNAVEFAGI